MRFQLRFGIRTGTFFECHEVDMFASSGVCSAKHRNIFTIRLTFILCTVISANGNYTEPVCTDGICKFQSKYADVKYPVTDEMFLDIVSHSLDSSYACLHPDCRCFTPFVENDLSPFKEGISKAMIDSAKKLGITYQIIDGHLYRDAICAAPKRCLGVEHYIHLQLNRLPNMEFVLNIDDSPKIRRGYPVFPLFSISKSKDYQDILIPSWDFWENEETEYCMEKTGYYQHFRNLLHHVTHVLPWEKKKNAAFFRGVRVSEDGDKIVYLSRIRPDLADVKYTTSNNSASVLFRKPAEQVPIREMCNYKYLFNIRGVAANIRYRYMFLCKSLVLGVGDEWYEFFTSTLVPWTHYVPIKNVPLQHQIERLVEFLIENDGVAKMIAEEGYELMHSHLRVRDIVCYWIMLLQKYGELVQYEVKRDFSLKEVERC